MGEPDFEREPVRAAKTAHDVAEDGERAILDLVDGLDARLDDGVAERRYVAGRLEGHDLASVVEVFVCSEPAERRLKVRGVPRKHTDEAE